MIESSIFAHRETIGRVAWAPDDSVYVGHVVGEPSAMFHGASIRAAFDSFKEVVDTLKGLDDAERDVSVP